MSQFTDMMSKWEDMCNYYKAEDGVCYTDCPLIHKEICYRKEAPQSKNDYFSIEKAIMEWERTHRYPTWAEFLKMYEMYDEHVSDYAIIKKLCDRRVPAEIAKKLGIEPVYK